MFLVLQPDAPAIERFLEESRRLPLSYNEVGLVRLPGAAGRDVDETAVVIGRGDADYARARAALAGWRQFDLGWVRLYPPAAPAATGTTVALVIAHLGFWSMNACRVVFELDDRDQAFGYAYGTLTNHAESGEELFEVSVDSATGDVVYRIRAVSTPRAPLARLGYPFVRALQARFRRDSAAAMARALRGDRS